MGFAISGASPGVGDDGNHWFDLATYKRSITELAADGATHANFRQIYFQKDWQSSAIASGHWTQTDAALIGSLTYAKAIGLKTSLYIQIETTDVSAQMRDTLDPANPAQWFHDYKAAALHVAAIASKTGTDFISLGGELFNMSTRPEFREYWLDIIADIRKIYGGKIGFTEFWSPERAPVEHLSFADALDMVGLSFYNPTSPNPGATIEDMVNAWFGANRFDSNYVAAIQAIHAAYGKPIYFGEISTWAFDGATSQYTTSDRPSGVDNHIPGSLGSLATDLQEQANYFEAAYRVWSAAGGDWMKGFLWWDWYERPDPKTSTVADLRDYANNFSPNGKPAADVIAYWNSNAADLTGTDVQGTAADDFLIGRKGPDHFFPVAGNDVIYGLQGVDTVDVAGMRTAYSLTDAPGSIILSGSTQTIALIDVERVHFSDGTLAIDQSGNAGQSYRIYQAAFDRTPDSEGLKFWISRMDSGQTLGDVAKGFVGSSEFVSVYGNDVSNSAFIEKLYENVLGRDGEQSGIEFWVGQLQSGATKAAVLAGFSESAENIAGVAPSIADGIWLA